MADGRVRPMPSYSYPGLRVLEAIAEGLGSWSRAKTCREISELLELPKRRVQAALAGLISLGLARRVRRSAGYLYRVEGGASVEEAALSHPEVSRVLWISLTSPSTVPEIARMLYRGGRKSTREKRATYTVRLAEDLGLVSRSSRVVRVTEEGAVAAMARALEGAYRRATHVPGEPVTLTRLREEMARRGLSREAFNALILDAVEAIPGAMLSPAPAWSRTVVRDAIRDERGRLLYFLSIWRGGG